MAAFPRCASNVAPVRMMWGGYVVLNMKSGYFRIPSWVAPTSFL